MWKYVSRRIRDTIERNANHFERRSTTGFANTTNGNGSDGKGAAPSCRWYTRCCDSYEKEHNTNSNRWNFEPLNRTWIGAITWSSALVLGWYASQLLHLKYKYKEPAKNCPRISGIFSALQPYVQCVKSNRDKSVKSLPNIEDVLKPFVPTVHLVTNEHNGDNKESSNGVSSGASSSDSSDTDLGDVLNAIENKLGWAAIENGHHQEGLNLLRSAAKRNHAPAQYNLGLCYEMGLGVVADEKMAMELYRLAAAREHPVALYNLGIYYGQGRGGLARDDTTATRLLRLAAVQGQKDAINALKVLDVPTIEPKPQNDADHWTFAYAPPPYSPNGNVPTQSSLFVENAQMLHTNIY